jgi:hypothetical protein
MFGKALLFNIKSIKKNNILHLEYIIKNRECLGKDSY